MEQGLEPALLTEAHSGLSPSLVDFLAGGIGGACGVVAGQPLDTVRIRQQQPGAGGGGAAQFIRAILSAEGGRALFRGLSYPLCTAALQNAVVFQSFGAAGRYLTAAEGQQQQPPLLSLSQVFWAGCFAGVVQTAVVVPVDLLKIRLQVQTAVKGSPGYVGPLGMLTSVLRAQGVAGVYFWVYEACRELFEPGSRASGSNSLLALWAAGGVGGAVSWLSVYPADVVKSRLQAAGAAGQASPYKGWWDCAWQSYAAEGPGVFVRGLGTTLGRAFLVNGAIFTAYEGAHKVLTQRRGGGGG